MTSSNAPIRRRGFYRCLKAQLLAHIQQCRRAAQSAACEYRPARGKRHARWAAR